MLSPEQARAARLALMGLVGTIGYVSSLEPGSEVRQSALSGLTFKLADDAKWSRDKLDALLVGLHLASDQPESVWETVTAEGDDPQQFRCAVALVLASADPSGWWAIVRLSESSYETVTLDGPQEHTSYSTALIDLLPGTTAPLAGRVVDLSTPWLTRPLPGRADPTELDPSMRATRPGQVAWSVATGAPDAADQVRDLWTDAPEDLAPVLAALMTTPLQHCDLVDVAMDHVDERDLLDLADAFAIAIARRQKAGDSVAAQVARILALQAPETLRPHAEAARAVHVREYTGVEIDEDVDDAEAVFHVEFPPGFLAPDEAPDRQGLPPSPTWHLDTPIAGSGRFGGTVASPCALCGHPLHLLIGLDVVPDGLRVPAQIVTCLSCVGWSAPILSFDHDGPEVRPIGSDLGPSMPEFPADPLPVTAVTLRTTPRRWRRQEWTHLQNLHRFGGRPTWVQSPETPDCPRCYAPMDFLLQLDSLDITGGPWWLWGSGGLLYVFTCADCDTTSTFWQCS